MYAGHPRLNSRREHRTNWLLATPPSKLSICSHLGCPPSTSIAALSMAHALRCSCWIHAMIVYTAMTPLGDFPSPSTTG